MASMGATVTDVQFEKPEEKPDPEAEAKAKKEAAAKAKKEAKAKKAAEAKAKKEAEAKKKEEQEGQQAAEDILNQEGKQFKYVCEKCGGQFDEPRMSGPKKDIKLCPEPECGSMKIKENK